MSLELIDNELESIVKQFLNSLVKTKVAFDEMRQIAQDKGITDNDLIDLLRYFAQQMKVPERTLYHWLKPLRTKLDCQVAEVDDNILPEDINLFLGDFRNIEIKSNSIPLIFTDPPYGLDTVDLYEDLGEYANRVLTDGGSLVTFVGQYTLLKVANVLENSGLTYWWQLVVKHSAGNQAIHPKGVFCEYKPLLWFVKGDKRRSSSKQLQSEEYLSDYIQSEKPDKKLHEWAQSEVEADHVIKRLTKSGEMVLDPFMGSGTTGISAINLKRKFTGVEIDQKYYNIARKRFSETNL